MRYRDQVVIITGGAKGIGEGCVRAFIAEGGLVEIYDIDEQAGTHLAEECSQTGPGTARFLKCDVSDQIRFRECIQQTVSHYERLDCLINNAGVHPPATPLEQFSVEQMEQLMRVNFISTYTGAQAALPHLRETRGTIINISSMTGELGQRHSTAYSATKAAQIGFTKALAIEAGEYGVRVNAVLPSNVNTPLMREWAATLPNPDSALNQVAQLQVLGRMASIDEIGRICLFLATPDSSFITGQAIQADGGASLDYSIFTGE